MLPLLDRPSNCPLDGGWAYILTLGVLHAKRGGGVQIACEIAFILNGRPLVNENKKNPGQQLFLSNKLLYTFVTYLR